MREAPGKPEFEHAYGGPSDRRELLKAMGASLALAGLAGCRGGADPEARPYVVAPPGEVLGKARFYASAVTLAGFAQPVLGETHEGRPTKLEGLPEHPVCLGATDAFTQAALLGLYDPDRSRAPRLGRQITTWSAFDTAMVQNAGRLDNTRGEGLRLLTRATSSPTFRRQLASLLSRWPHARWHVFEPVNEDLRAEAARIAYGRRLYIRPRLDVCDAIVSFDDDVLGPGPAQCANARAWARRRQRFQRGEGRIDLFVAEPTPTLTGAVASNRLAASADQVELLVKALAQALGVSDGPTRALTARQQQWVTGAADALKAASGQGVVLVGAHYPANVQALGLLINQAIGAAGRTLSLHDPVLLEPPDGPGSFDRLLEDLAADQVDTLVVIDANPAYAAPGRLNFAALMRKARLRIHAGLYYDETAALSHWHAPLEHDLETWSDARAVDGRTSLIQPMVRPFYDVRSRSLVLENLQGKLDADPRTILNETWRGRLGGLSDQRWLASLQRGFLDDPAPTLQPGRSSGKIEPRARAPAKGLTVLFRPDPTVWDGSLANNAWLQELPKPFNKVTWENVIAISPALASAHQLENGDRVGLTAGARTVTGPVWITPGQDRSTVIAYLGYGRRLPGALADGLGYDAYSLLGQDEAWRLNDVQLSSTGEGHKLASTQPHTQLDGFDFVRTSPRSAVAPGPPPSSPPSFYPPAPEPGPQWGMSIDTDLCIACNACVSACMAENNVPVVGRKEVAEGREMHWLRIDQYYAGPQEDPEIFNQPVPCMHCEQAPCEMGCPVNAAVHSTDGLNLQVYNRCIGTRTCSSFCPYKVRRFNWFDFTADDPPELRAARNPDVTVRARGVMEKCTYCVQRISEARIQAKLEGRPIRDSEVRTACQQVCPTDAIVFGDVSDPNSRVSRLKAQQRNYTLLEHVNTRPRTTYLARISEEPSKG